MTDLRKAAEMALDALEKKHGKWGQGHDELNAKAITALRQALAQPEQTPVEPPDYVEPVTFDYHDGWEEGFKAGVEAKTKGTKMTLEEFRDYVVLNAMYETIYTSSDGQSILVITMLDAYALVYKRF